MTSPAWKTEPPTRALTLRQPWAWAICWAHKRVENRNWSPRGDLPMPIAIHAGSRPAGQRYIQMAEDVAQLWDADIPVPGGWWDAKFDPQAPPGRHAFAWGAIVAVADVVAVGASPPPAFDHPNHRMWWSGGNAWWLDRVHVLERPIVARGRQGLWTLGGPQHDALRQQLAAL